MFSSIGWAEVLLVLLVVLLLFGATRLPKLARSMGQSIHGFKKGLSEGAAEDEDDAKPSPAEASAEKKDEHPTT